MPAQLCPNQQELSSFNIGKLPDQRREEIAMHLESCSDCQGTLETLSAEGDWLLASLQQPVAEQPYADAPGLKKALAVIEAIGRDPSFATAKVVVQGAGGESDLGTIRDYKLLAKLGEGGMGAVYKALHLKLEKVVALKVLPANRLQNPDAVSRFEREMKAVGKLAHPNIVAAHDAGEHEGQHFLVMEYVDGLDLSALVRTIGHALPLPPGEGRGEGQSGMTVADACELIRQAALGLQHAHQRGMVHRDIKPSNLMLAGVESTECGMRHDDSGNSILPNPNSAIVKILDMGLALLDDQRTGERRDLTSTGQMMGTLDYMAPEQGMDSHIVDIRADIYSLGATLYKLLCGEAPFSSAKYNTPVKMLMALGMESAPSIASKRDDLAPDLVAIVDRMLAKQPEDRFATPAEVAEALAPFAAGANLAELARRASEAASLNETTEHKSRSTDPHASSALLDTTSNMPAAEPSEKHALGAGTRLVRGLPTPHPSPTEGLQEPASGRPAVGQLARSGDRATTAQGHRAATGAATPASWLSKPRNRILAVAACVVGIALLAAVLVIRLQDDKSEIIIEADSDVEVAIKQLDGDFQGNIELTQGKGQTTVRAGRYEIIVKNAAPDQFNISDKIVTLERRGRQVIKIERKPRVDNKRANPIHSADQKAPKQGPPENESLPDGEWIVDSAGDKLAGIVSNPAQHPGLGRWNVVPTLPGLGKPTTTFDVSPDGRYLAAANADDYVRIYDLKTGQVIGICSEFGENAEVMWNPTSNLVLVKTLRSPVHTCIYEPNGTKRGEFPNQSANYEQIASATTYLRSFGYYDRTPWHSAGRLLVLVGSDGAAICSFDGRVITKLDKSFAAASDALWSPDGELLLLTSDSFGRGQGVYGIWRNNGEFVRFFDSDKDGRFLSWCPDAESITTITNSGELRRVGIDGESEKLIEQSIEDSLKSRVFWSPNGRWFILRSESAKVFSADGAFLREYGPHGLQPYLAWSPDSTRFANFSRPHATWKIYGIESDKAELAGEDSFFLKWMQNGQGFSTYSEGALQVYGGNSNKGHQAIGNHGIGGNYELAASPDGSMIASADDDGKLRLWSSSGQLERIISITPQANNWYGAGCLSWTPDGKRISISTSRALELWSIDGQSRQTVEVPPDSQVLLDAAFSPTGTALAVRFLHGDDYYIRIRTSSGSWTDPLAHHGRNVFAMAWSADGKWLAVGGANAEGLVRLYNADGEAGPTFRAWPNQPPQQIAWYPDGKRLAMLWETIVVVYNMDSPGEPTIFSKETRWESGLTGRSDTQIWWMRDSQVLVFDVERKKLTRIDRPQGARQFIGALHGEWFTASCPGSNYRTYCYLANMNIQTNRTEWTSLPLSDGDYATFGPEGQLRHIPKNVNQELTYVVEQPGGELVPLNRDQFLSRINLSEGQQAVQFALDVGRSIRVAGSDKPMTAGDFKTVHDLPEVENVVEADLSDSLNVNRDSMAVVARLTSLTKLDLHNTAVDTFGLSHLRGLTQLRELNLAGLDIVGRLSDLAELAKLEQLDLSGTRVTDSVIETLVKLANLKHLDLSGTEVTESGIERLRKALPDCEIITAASDQ